MSKILKMVRQTSTALDALRCNHLAPLGLKGCIIGLCISRGAHEFVIGHKIAAKVQFTLQPTDLHDSYGSVSDCSPVDGADEDAASDKRTQL